MQQINPDIVNKVFKNYDIRGLVGSQITAELAYAIGNAFVQHFKVKKAVVGRDGRKESLEYQEAMMNGMLDAGCDVVDVGLVSTPQIKWIVAHHDFPAGVMITASHNPAAYNGFKFVGKAGLAIGEDAGLHEIKPLLDKPFKGKAGEKTAHNYLEEFVKFTLEKADIHTSDREVFIDGSGGVFALEMEKTHELADFNFTFYNTELDPEFKVHPPNPLEPAATAYAKEYCKMHSCIGVVFDADGDRSIFIDEAGEEVPGDYYGAWVAQKTFGKDDGATSTVRDSRAVRDVVLRGGGRFMLGKVGHANIQRLMYDNKLRLGTEKSGHVFFQESYYAENGLYGLLLVLKHLDKNEKLADGNRIFRLKYHTSPEINFKVTDTKKAIEEAKKHYATRGEVNTMDGVLCEGKDWWVNIRPSNTEPLLRLTFEAPSKHAYEALQKEAESVILPFKAGDVEKHH